MRGVLAIVAKDLRQRSRDRTILLYGVVAPLVLATVLGGVFSSLDTGISARLGVAVDGTSGARFVQQVLPVLLEQGVIDGRELYGDRDALLASVEDGTVDAGLVLVGDDVEVVSRADAPTVAGLAEAIASTWTQEQRTRQVAAELAATVAPEAAAATQTALDASGASVSLTDRPTGVGPLDVDTYISAGMAVFFLLFAVGIAMTGLLEEAEAGTLARLRTAPIGWAAPVIAKAVVAALVGVGSMLVLVVATTALVGARWGAPLGVLSLVVSAVLAATGIMLLVAAAVRGPESSQSVTAVVGTVMGTIGGSFFPVRGQLLELLGSLTPHHWFLLGLTRNAGGAGAAEVAPAVLALLTIAAAAGSIAMAVLSRRGEV